MRRNPEGAPERASEMRFGHAAYAGKTFNRPILVRGCVNPILGAQQAT
jgi:hypothetical protein